MVERREDYHADFIGLGEGVGLLRQSLCFFHIITEGVLFFLDNFVSHSFGLLHFTCNGGEKDYRISRYVFYTMI
jgi:hypothetical protein